MIYKKGTLIPIYSIFAPNKEAHIKGKLLVVNAEDFGLDKNIDRGIAECFTDGVVRSVSLVANGPAFQDALALIKGRPHIGAGVHLCLVNEKPLLPKKDIPSIVDDQGDLPQNWLSLVAGIYLKKIRLNDVKKEFQAQIEKILDNGIKPTHLDSHQYAHLIPAVFDITVELAKKYNINYIRCPKYDKIYFISLGNCLKKIHLVFFQKYQAGQLKKNGIRSADHACGFMASGRLNENIITDFLKDVPSGIIDINCHPGHYPANKKYSAWKYRWQEESNMLKSETIKDLIKKLNITISNYAA